MTRARGRQAGRPMRFEEVSARRPRRTCARAAAIVGITANMSPRVGPREAREMRCVAGSRGRGRGLSVLDRHPRPPRLWPRGFFRTLPAAVQGRARSGPAATPSPAPVANGQGPGPDSAAHGRRHASA